MEICKNKASNKYFIYIGETGNEEALMVTPNAEIKSLRTELFDSPEEYSEQYLLEENLITAEQIKRFHGYKKNRSDDVSENLNYYFDQLSPYEQKLLIIKLQNIFGLNQNKD